MADSLRVSVRLSATTDLDLLILAETSPIQWLLQQSIKAYISDAEYEIALPETTIVGEDNKIIFFRFSDSEIIEWLQAIPKGRRSIVIKMLLRHYMNKPDMKLYLNVTPTKREKPLTATQPITIQKAKKAVVPTPKPIVAKEPVQVAQPTIQAKPMLDIPSEPCKSSNDGDDNIFDLI